MELFLTAGAPSDWIRRWAGALPHGATVLDLACGSGRHARWCAARGLRVTAVDRDAAAIASLRGVVHEALVADLEADPWPLAARQFDAVIVTHYLWRALWPALLASVAPGGWLLYETFGSEQPRVGRPTRPEFLLREAELLEVCAGQLKVVAYEDGWLAAPQRHVQRVAVWRAQPGADVPALACRIPD